MKQSAEYMREYRASGRDMTSRARSRAAANLVKWTIRECPDVWRDFLGEARKELGMPVELSPGGQFTKPIEHGTPSGYRAHIYRSETPCTPCRDAENARARESYRRRQNDTPTLRRPSPSSPEG